GITLMTPLGLLGALTHMVFHAIMKISSFFCAGAVMQQSGKTDVKDLEGMGRKMPFTFVCFAVASLSLMGMPPLIGFISKYNLATAAISNGGWLSYLTVAALFISSILVAIYMLTIVIRAFFPRYGIVVAKTSDPGIMMKIPITIFTVLIFVVGVYSAPLIHFLTKVANGLV
ncbi:MAG: proton-conducting transporter membrane subunit, partial [Oscillospiraceae bacterium]